MTSEPVPTRGDGTARKRLIFGLCAAVAAAVAIVFATIGDGVDVPEASGTRILVDYAHIAVWVLLAAAFGVGAWHGRWGRVAEWFAGAAGLATSRSWWRFSSAAEPRPDAVAGLH